MTPKEILAVAKRTFFTGVMENEVLAKLVTMTLMAHNESITADLPEFEAEPRRPEATEDGQPLGLQLRTSLSQSDGMFTVSVGTFCYLTVLYMSTRVTEATLLVTDQEVCFNGSDALMTLDTELDAKKNAALHFMRYWQGFLQTAGICGAHIDSMMHTFTTEERCYLG